MSAHFPRRQGHGNLAWLVALVPDYYAWEPGPGVRLDYEAPGMRRPRLLGQLINESAFASRLAAAPWLDQQIFEC